MANVDAKSTLVMPGEATPSCWSCGTMRAVHFCNACGKVQPPVPVDYFTFFGFPRKLNLNTATLEKEFYALSRKLHPDVFGQADDQERTWSLEQSSRLNDAYRTLKDPVKRTEYLLKLEGVELEEQSKQATEKARATGELKKQVVPPDLLEEMFELNMQLEELRMQKKMGEDDPALIEEISQAKLALEEKHDALLHELKTQWNEWDKVVDASESDRIEIIRRQILDKMVDVLNRRNYIRNLVRDVSEVLEG
ncbi:MAG TPA: Fe-S protein assembly co-chaperone HscB [Terriglobales bacterium]|jgi:molecular chaperone HscB|nr:Fe-S protein assembly co-chaperone HscB [Terriglobales bacterium]